MASSVMKVSKRSKETLDSFKLVPQESYDHVLYRLFLLQGLADNKTTYEMWVKD